MERLLQIAKAHSMTAWIVGDALHVEVDWIHIESRKIGTDIEIAHNERELLAILGY